MCGSAARRTLASAAPSVPSSSTSRRRLLARRHVFSGAQVDINDPVNLGTCTCDLTEAGAHAYAFFRHMSVSEKLRLTCVGGSQGQCDVNCCFGLGTLPSAFS